MTISWFQRENLKKYVLEIIFTTLCREIFWLLWNDLVINETLKSLIKVGIYDFDRAINFNKQKVSNHRIEHTHGRKFLWRWAFLDVRLESCTISIIYYSNRMPRKTHLETEFRLLTQL